MRGDIHCERIKKETGEEKREQDTILLTAQVLRVAEWEMHHPKACLLYLHEYCSSRYF